MKDAYKKTKDNNSKTGTSPIYPPCYNDFEEMLASGDVINVKYIMMTTQTDGVEKSFQPGSPILELGK